MPMSRDVRNGLIFSIGLIVLGVVTGLVFPIVLAVRYYGVN